MAVRRKGKSILRGVEVSRGLYLLNGLGVVNCPLPACYTFAVDTGEGLILVDPGLPDTWARVRDNLSSLELSDREIPLGIITHAHGDHALAGKFLREDFGTKLLASDYAAHILNEDIVNAFKENPAYVRYSGDSYPEIETVADGAGIALGEISLRVIYTPGHSPGCLSLYGEVYGRKILFCGDLVFPDGTVGHVGSKSFSASDILRSLKTVADLPVDIICGGHFYKAERAGRILNNVLRRAEERLSR